MKMGVCLYTYITNYTGCKITMVLKHQHWSVLLQGRLPCSRNACEGRQTLNGIEGFCARPLLVRSHSFSTCAVDLRSRRERTFTFACGNLNDARHLTIGDGRAPHGRRSANVVEDLMHLGLELAALMSTLSTTRTHKTQISTVDQQRRRRQTRNLCFEGVATTCFVHDTNLLSLGQGLIS